ncbi:MAG: acyltransferase [Ruminococcus sp.]|nr:acyltransferase [Ruminococcus sp.]
MRKHFIDNLRWADVFLLIPYHTAQAFNTWGELNYICLQKSRAASSLIVFLSPFFMPLLFLLAGMSTRYALKKRSCSEYIVERVKRLIVPLVFGTLALCPILAYIGDVTNCGYSGSFLEHYRVFFTKWTDLSGYDGGFGVGQFWFLLYLFVISLICLPVIALVKKHFESGDKAKGLPFAVLCLMGLPLPLLYDLLSVGGKSLTEYTYIFLIGYFVLSDDRVIERAEKYRHLTLAIGFAAGVLNVYMFIWSGKDYGAANVIVKAAAEWFMILALIGTGKSRLDCDSRVTRFMSQRSFAYFSLHFVWVVLFQYLLADAFGGSIVLLYMIPMLCAFAATFICTEVFVRVPVLCFLTGTKPVHNKQRENNK